MKYETLISLNAKMVQQRRNKGTKPGKHCHALQYAVSQEAFHLLPGPTSGSKHGPKLASLAGRVEPRQLCCTWDTAQDFFPGSGWYVYDITS